MPHRNYPIDPAAAKFVLIEDDHLLLDLLSMALRAHVKTNRIQSFASGRAAIEHCRRDKPNLAIVDLGLPDMDGRAVIRALLSIDPDMRIIVLTGNLTATLPAELIALGVCGYIDKGSPLENTISAVRRVLEGGIFFSASVRPASAAPFSPTPANEVLPEQLTARELEIARLVSGGMISKEVAERLNLSPRTIEKARSDIVAKLKVRDLPGLVRWCVKHGLI